MRGQHAGNNSTGNSEIPVSSSGEFRKSRFTGKQGHRRVIWKLGDKEIDKLFHQTSEEWENWKETISRTEERNNRKGKEIEIS